MMSCRAAQSSQVYEGEYRAGKRDGRGVYMYAGGDVYEGEYKAGKMEGRGTYRLADGTAEVGRYFAGADVGEGARWSADRKTGAVGRNPESKTCPVTLRLSDNLTSDLDPVGSGQVPVQYSHEAVPGSTAIGLRRPNGNPVAIT